MNEQDLRLHTDDEGSMNNATKKIEIRNGEYLAELVDDGRYHIVFLKKNHVMVFMEYFPHQEHQQAKEKFDRVLANPDQYRTFNG